MFSGNYNYITDGAAVALNRLVGFLERHGVEVLVFSPTGEKPAFEHTGTLVSVPSVRLPAGRGEYRLGLGLPRAARRRLVAFGPNLIHLSAPDLLGAAALRYARRRNIPAVASFHTRYDTYFQYYRLGWLENTIKRYLRWFYNRCERVFVPTESVATVLRQDGLEAEMHLWGRGVDHRRFHPDRRDMAWRQSLGIDDNDVVITFVGRLVREKGLKCFVDVIDGLRQAGVAHRVLVVGDGPERAWMQQRLPEAVFTGFVEGDSLARAYASSDIFVNPSITETFGIVTLEAMSSGLPCVCADATGARSVIEDGSSGYLVDPQNVRAYVEVLSRLAAAPLLRRSMARAARERSEAFSWDAVMEPVLREYYAVIGACAPAAAAAVLRADQARTA